MKYKLEEFKGSLEGMGMAPTFVKHSKEIMVSKCCKAEYKLGGDGVTHYWVCKSCNKACNLIL